MITASDGTQLDQGVALLARAIRTTESNNNYNAVGDKGASKGAYQFNGNNFETWAKQYNLDPKDFSPVNQDKVAYARMLDLKNQGFTPEQVAAAWNAGVDKAKSGAWQQNVGTNAQGIKFDTPAYVQSVIGKYQQFAQGVQNGPTLPNPSQAQPQPEQPSVGGFIGNIFSSGAGVIGGLANALFHPIQTLQGIGSAVAGGVEKLIPGQQADEQSFNNLVDFFKNRYGSIDALKKTAYTDPVGLALDLSTVLGGAGAGLRAAGKIGEIGGLARAGEIAGRAAEITDPLLQGGKLIGKAVSPIAGATERAPASILNAAVGTTAKDFQIGKAPGEFLAQQGHFGTESQLMNQFQESANVLRAEILRKTATTPGDLITQDVLTATKDALLNKYKGAYSSEHIDAAVNRAPVAGLLEKPTLSYAEANQLRESLGKIVGTRKFEATAEQSLANEVNQTLYRKLQEAIKPATGTTEEFAALSKYMKAIKRLEAKMGKSEKYALNIGLKDIGFGLGGLATGGPLGAFGTFVGERAVRSTLAKTALAQAIQKSSSAMRAVSDSKYAKALLKARVPIAQAGRLASQASSR